MGHHICLSIGNVDYEEVLSYIQTATMAEIRIDLLCLNAVQLNTIFSSHGNLIATCRPGKHDDVERATILMEALRSGAAYVDVEIDALPQWRQPIIDLAHRLNRKVIVSYHNFILSPGRDELIGIAKSLFRAGADIAKIASKVNSPADASSLLSLYSDFKNIVAMGMGSDGMITRLAASMLGAPFTYASIDGKETAPGQVPINVMDSFFNLIKPADGGNA